MRSFIFKNPPFPQCHGSTIAQMVDGCFSVAWFAGTREMHTDTSIWWCRQDGGEWSKPKIIAKVANMAHWNPVLYPNDDGAILYFKVGRFPDSWDTWKVRIDLQGNCTNKPRKLKSFELECGKMTMGPVRGKIVRTSSGSLLAPSSIEKILARRLVGFRMKSDVAWESVIHRSRDNGKTWKTCYIPYHRPEGSFGGIIQPSVWESAPGKCSALMRSTKGYLYRSDSTDDGKTWSVAVQTDMPNPNSAVDIATSGDLLALVYNPVSGDWAKRTPISVAFSNLEGKTFHCRTDIESGVYDSYAYPAIIAVKDGFAMTYTWNRENIAFAHIRTSNIQWIGDAPTLDVSYIEGPAEYFCW